MTTQEPRADEEAGVDAVVRTLEAQRRREMREATVLAYGIAVLSCSLFWMAAFPLLTVGVMRERGGNPPPPENATAIAIMITKSQSSQHTAIAQAKPMAHGLVQPPLRPRRRQRRALLQQETAAVVTIYDDGVLSPGWTDASFLADVNYEYVLPISESSQEFGELAGQRAVLTNAQPFGGLSFATTDGAFFFATAGGGDSGSGGPTPPSQQQQQQQLVGPDASLAFAVHALYPEQGARLVLKLEARASNQVDARLFTGGVPVATLAEEAGAVGTDATATGALTRGVLPLDQWYEVVVRLDALVAPAGGSAQPTGPASFEALRALGEVPATSIAILEKARWNRTYNNNDFLTTFQEAPSPMVVSFDTMQAAVSPPPPPSSFEWLWDTITIQDDAGSGAAFLVDNVRLVSPSDLSATAASGQPTRPRRSWMIAVIVASIAVVCFAVVGIAVLVVGRRERGERGKTTADDVRGAIAEVNESIGDVFDNLAPAAGQNRGRRSRGHKDVEDDAQTVPGWTERRYSPDSTKLDHAADAQLNGGTRRGLASACCLVRPELSADSSAVLYRSTAKSTTKPTTNTTAEQRTMTSDERLALDEILRNEWRDKPGPPQPGPDDEQSGMTHDADVPIPIDADLKELHDQALWHLDTAELKRRDAELAMLEAESLLRGSNAAAAQIDQSDNASVCSDDSETGVRFAFAKEDDESPQQAQAALLYRQADALRSAADVYDSEGKRLLSVWAERMDAAAAASSVQGDVDGEVDQSSSGAAAAAAAAVSLVVAGSTSASKDDDDDDPGETEDVVVPLRQEGAAVAVAPLRVDFAKELELESVVGSGASGTVWKAWYRPRGTPAEGLPTDVPVACKIMHGSGVDQASFDAEVSLLSSLRHPNIVRCFGSGSRDGSACVLMEYVDGPSLHVALHEQHMQPSLAAVHRLARELAEAMAWCHSLPMPVVHRDLKSQNVLLDRRTGSCKVCDFGIARKQSATFLTTKHLHAGTVSYMAPETFKGGSRTVNEKCDVYSYGVLLWELLSGEVPWSAEASFSPMSVVMAVGVEKRRLPLPTSWPRYLRRVIKACWRHDARVRCSFEEVLRRLADHDDGGA